MSVNISNEGLRRIVSSIADEHYPMGRKIEAIKRLRELTGFGLKESKDLMEMEFNFREPRKVIDPVLDYINRSQGSLTSDYPRS